MLKLMKKIPFKKKRRLPLWCDLLFHHDDDNDEVSEDDVSYIHSHECLVIISWTRVSLIRFTIEKHVYCINNNNHHHHHKPQTESREQK
ncbi:hypothetical protein DERP_005856 [Dermatophagoides pteronyssinus]|uniref:Uncharacterized protein n=1 Tax=Dermatophagoides pteronyssinus TaxID=6956 RepID=A0ABQ8J9T2_DERPT|nr:hypothetical protein DERP_005856 [Dermatophagoides pteronyssinus]